MKIKNKLLFAFFLTLDILVVGCATYINTISHKINVLLTVIAVFIPLPCLWQTNIDDYTAKTKIGKKIVEQITGIGLLLCIHILFLLILHFIGAILISKEEAAPVIFITVFIIAIIAISVLFALSIDKKAKKYAKLSSEEIFLKISIGENIRAGGLSVIKTSFILISIVIIVKIITGLGNEVFNSIPKYIDEFIINMLLPGLTYCLFATIIGLLIYVVGRCKIGTIARALNLYIERELTPEEKKFVQDEIDLEEWAKQIRSQQIIGDLVGDNIVGNAIKAKSVAGSVSIINTMSKSKTGWFKIITIFGLILTLLIYNILN